MARLHTKCAECLDLLWFGDNDEPDQSVICICGGTRLLESGAEGNFTNLNQQEIDSLNGG